MHRIVGEVMTSYYGNHLIDDIEAKIDIVDVISETVNLTRKGNRYWGICPFHAEKTPSFSVSAEKNMFYCFGCHTGGNMFSFIMKRDGVDFKEAIQILAARAGVKLITAPRKKDDKRARVFEINKKACEYYSQYLLGDRGKAGRDYFNRRQVSQKSIQDFKLGLAPQEWDCLEKYLIKKGFSHDDVVFSGLIKRNENRNSFYDVFRNRLMFPILNASGEVIGFGGRVLDESLPKYLNTAETDLFAKRKNLYGLYQGKEFIRKSNEAILVEGYMDCIKLHQSDIKNTVASLGTAFTAEQASLLLKYTENVLILYDGDEAGQRETLKAIDALSDKGFNIFIASLPDKMDPDDFLNRFGKEEFLGFIKNNKISHIEFKITSYLKLSPELNLEDKVKIINLVKRDIQRLKSELDKDFHIKALARKLMVEENLIHREYISAGRYKEKEGILRKKTEIIRDNKNYGNYSLEEKILAAILEDLDILSKVKNSIGLDFFAKPELAIIADYYDKLPGEVISRQNELKIWATENNLDGILARITFLFGENYLDKFQINSFIQDTKRKNRELLWQKVFERLDELNIHGDFNNLLSFILNLDTFLNNFQEGGRS
jgi:DNA primase